MELSVNRSLSRLMRIPFLLCCLVLSTSVAAESALQGAWRINLEETDKVAVKYEDGSGMKGGGMKPSINVMGLPMPRSYRQSPMSDLAAKDPAVLRCTAMRIDVQDKKVALHYDGDAQETLVKGDYRGRTSKWSKRKIQQKYKTPERTVTKTWSLRDDGRLLVAVKINPRGDKARTFKRVFDPVTQTPQTGVTEPGDADG